MSDEPPIWNVQSLKELHDEKINADRALGKMLVGGVCVVVALGWHEIQRRLIVLNHAHEQHEATLAASVSSDKYESDKQAEDLRVGTIETRMAEAAERERSSEKAASRAEGARFEQRSDLAGGEAARRQNIALILSAAAIVVSLIIAFALTRSKPTVIVPTPAQVTTTTAP